MTQYFSPRNRSFLYMLSTVLLISQPSTAYNATINRNYFNFPPLTDWIPVFAVGDTLNISWSSEYANLDLNVWCGTGIYRSK
jgi:hypothetical protein